MFVVLTKRHIFAGFFVIILSLLAIFSHASDTDATARLCTEHLKSLGYYTTSARPESITTVEIPLVFDEVFLSYNSLQQEAGFDLSVFCGQTLLRYTFCITDADNPLYANLLIYDGQIIGGEIVNPRLDGYMLALKER